MRSLRISCENSQNRIRSAVPPGLPLPLLEKGDVTATYRKLGPKNRGYFSFRVGAVGFPWGFRVCTLHNLLYSPGAGPICRNLPIPADTYSTEL
jgi:hypothetical protein